MVGMSARVVANGDAYALVVRPPDGGLVSYRLSIEAAIALRDQLLLSLPLLRAEINTLLRRFALERHEPLSQV